MQRLEFVARKLMQLDSEVVFTGGAVVGLLLTDKAAPDVRPTDDVDVIVSVVRFSEYSGLQERLRQLGFKHDFDGPSCRFTLDGQKVDVMPTDGSILGFTNHWYDYALRTASNYELPGGATIRVVSAPAFLATKLEAFYDRGAGNFLMSHDLEDIIAVLDGREEFVEEMTSVDLDVRTYIIRCMTDLLSNRDFTEALSMHLLPDEVSQARAEVILNRMHAIADLL